MTKRKRAIYLQLTQAMHVKLLPERAYTLSHLRRIRRLQFYRVSFGLLPNYLSR